MEPEESQEPKYLKWQKYKDPNYSGETEPTPEAKVATKRDWSKFKDPDYEPTKDPESDQYIAPKGKKDESLWGKLQDFIGSKFPEQKDKSVKPTLEQKNNPFGIAGRAVGRGLSALLGFPGDIANLGTDLGSALSNLVTGQGFKTGPEAEELKNANFFPTSEQVKRAFGVGEEHHAEGALGFMEDVASLASELGALGVNPKSALKVAASGETAKKAAKFFGTSPSTQEGVGLAAMALASLNKPGEAKKFANRLMEEATLKAPIAPLSNHTIRNLKESTLEAQKTFRASAANRNAFKQVVKDLNRAQNVDQLVDIRRAANDLYPAVKGSGGEKLHRGLVTAIDSAIEDTVGHSAWHKEYLDAIETQRVFHSTRAAQENLLAHIKTLAKNPSVYTLAYYLHLIPASPALTYGGPALVAGATAAGLGGRTVLNRIMKSPQLRNHYETAFKAFMERNTPATINALTKLAKELEQESEEEEK